MSTGNTADSTVPSALPTSSRATAGQYGAR